MAKKEEMGAALSMLAQLAGEGHRFIVVVGKVKDKKVSKNRDTGEVTEKFPVVSGEGETFTLKAAPGSSQPAIGHEGAFLVGNVRTWENVTTGTLLEWI